jgi:hypothetical protein
LAGAALTTAANESTSGLTEQLGPDVPSDEAGYDGMDYVDEDLTTPVRDQMLYLPAVLR